MCGNRDEFDHEQANEAGLDRRRLLQAGAAAGAAVAAAGVATVSSQAEAGTDKYAPPAKPALPPSNMKLNLKRAALVVTDPQVDFLSPKGVT